MPSDKFDPIEVMAFVPINHIQAVGSPKFQNHDFPIGARLCKGLPRDIEQALCKLLDGSSFQMSNPHEINSLRAAKGFLYIKSSVDKSIYSHPGSIRDHIGNTLVPYLRTLLGCICICGGGENTHWYWGNFTDRPQIFIYSRHELVDLPYALQVMQPFEGKISCDKDWSKSVLRDAGLLHEELWRYKGDVIPRYSLVYHNYFLMLSLSPRSLVKRNVRLQIAITALETFYIAPHETMHLWSDAAMNRVLDVCSGFAEEICASVNSIKVARNDIVHRCGLSKIGKESDNIDVALYIVEKILRRTIYWAIYNRDIIRTIFETNVWPSARCHPSD